MQYILFYSRESAQLDSTTLLYEVPPFPPPCEQGCVQLAKSFRKKAYLGCKRAPGRAWTAGCLKQDAAHLSYQLQSGTHQSTWSEKCAKCNSKITPPAALDFRTG